MSLLEIVWDDVGWISLAQDSDKCGALVNAAMKFQVP
jgi:hypothetical protein